jgi:hypothetical protein
MCDYEPCMNGGTCVAVNGTFQCICPPQTTGYLCHEIQTITNPCLSAPCLNNGTCYQNGNSYRCVCQVNASGVNCEKINKPQGK